MRRWCSPILAAVAVAASLVAAPAGAFASAPVPALRVEGAVAAPAAFGMADLSALASTTVQVVEHHGRLAAVHTERAVALETLVNLAQPVLPAAKNALLRVTVTARAPGHAPVTFALGELDPNFGNHPALLSVEEDGVALRAPKLVVPGDANTVRFADRVERVVVGVANPSPTTPVVAGAVAVHHDGRDRVLRPRLLALLPARTVVVSFLAGTTAQQHVETGPNLSVALAAAGVHLRSDTWVAAVGSDGYVAVVTPAEAFVGGRTLLLSTAEDGAHLDQPRLVTGGDVKGGRYVSLVVDLVVGEG